MNAKRFGITIICAIILIALLPTALGLAQVNSFLVSHFSLGGGGTSTGGDFAAVGSIYQGDDHNALSGGVFGFSRNLQQPATYRVMFVNSAWVGTPVGTDLGNGRRFYSNAFHDIQTGYDRVEENGQIEVVPGTYTALLLNRPVTVNIQADAHIHGDLHLSGGSLHAPPGVLQLSGGFLQNGGVFDARNGTVRFSEAGEKNLTLVDPIQFSKLIVDSGVTLIETNPEITAKVPGLTNQGIIQKTLPISGIGEYSFGLTGAMVSFAKAGSLTQLKVEQVGQAHSQMERLPVGSVALPLYYKLTPMNGTGDAQICLAYTADQLTLVSQSMENELHLCQWTGADWSCYPRSQQSDPANRTVCADGVSPSSDWTIVTNKSSPERFYYLPGVFR